MRIRHLQHKTGQMGVEYLLIFAIIAIIVLASFRGQGLLYRIYNSQNPGTDPNVAKPDSYFVQVTRVIQGEKPNPINGGLCPGTNTCECPSPAFGGSEC